MRLVATHEERDLAAMLRDLLTTHCPTTLVRALAEPGGERFPKTLWSALASAGALGLGIAEEHGGSGGTLDDVGVLYREGGRALCPTVVHRTVELGLALDLLGTDEQRARVLPRLCAGELRGTVALWNPADAGDVRPRLTARAGADGGLVVDGSLRFVGDADLADLLLVSAGDGGRSVGLLVPASAPGLRIEPMATSAGDRLSRVVLDGVAVAAADVLAGPEGAGLAEADLRRAADTAMALQALDMVGGGEAVLERTVTYTRDRRQFGRPIASFQAAQHLVADMHIALAAARLAAQSAVARVGRRPAPREAAIAVLHAGTAYRRITLDAHQLHGGMGYVLETDLHLWSERARTLSTLGGGPDVAARRLQEELRRG
ncbi:acyl-CoA dehydrogenase family protein [Blastococcus sp. SYSU D00820]